MREPGIGIRTQSVMDVKCVKLQAPAARGIGDKVEQNGGIDAAAVGQRYRGAGRQRQRIECVGKGIEHGCKAINQEAVL